MDLIFSKIKINNDCECQNQQFAINEENNSSDNNNISKIENNNINIENTKLDDSKNIELCQKTDSKELTADGIPTINQQLKDIKEDEERLKATIVSDSEKTKRRDMIIRVKSICLHKMGKDIMVNTSYLSSKEKTKLIELMNEYLLKTEPEIIDEFNDICQETIFETKRDYSNYPVYNI